MRGKITKRAVDALALKKGTEVVLWDQEVRGFGIRARAGGAKPTSYTIALERGVERHYASSPLASTVRLGRPTRHAPRRRGCWV